jgi:hypothetical protein
MSKLDLHQTLLAIAESKIPDYTMYPDGKPHFNRKLYLQNLPDHIWSQRHLFRAIDGQFEYELLARYVVQCMLEKRGERIAGDTCFGMPIYQGVS